MKYRVGDVVKIKSRKWYNKNKNEYGYIICKDYETFLYDMSKYLGKSAKIIGVGKKYRLDIDVQKWAWTDEMLEDKTVWSIFKDLVNRKHVNTEITRQEMLTQIERELINMGKVKEAYGNRTVANFSSATLDSMRNMAEKVGFLTKGKKFGEFVVTKHFKCDYTVSQLRKDYDNRKKYA